MTSQYKKLSLQPPKSYEQLNRNRPTKRKNYNYTAQQDNDPESIKIPISNMYNPVRKDFSFEDIERSIPKKYTQTKDKISYNQEFSAIKIRDTEKSQSQSPIKRQKIDDRVNNIQSINDKINNLLNNTKSQGENKPVYHTPLAQRKVNLYEKNNTSKFSQSSASKIQNQTSYSSKLKDKSFKSKYAYVENQQSVNSNKPMLSKKYQYDISNATKTAQSEPKPSYRQKMQDLKLEELNVAKKLYKKNQYLYEQQSMKKNDFIQEQIQNKYEQTVKKESMLIKNMQLDRRISEIKHKILDQSPFVDLNVIHQENNIENIKKIYQNSYQPQPQLTQTSQISKIAKNLSKVIQIDIILLKIRQAFEKCSEANKWAQLKSQLQIKGIYLQENQMKYIFTISIHEKNPFETKKPQYPLNGVKDLGKLYAEAERIWMQEIEKCVSLDSLAEEDFSLTLVDINTKGTISLQDLVCFINLNSSKFYRSRDVAPLFKRFLKLQDKTIDKDIVQGIQYGTFMKKLAV